MRINLSLPNNQQVTALTDPWMRRLGGEDLARITRIADELGYHKITVGEHLAIPASHVVDSGSHYLQATTALAFLAASAPRIRVGSNVTLLALQHPVVQAKMWAVLDWLSGGRADINIGVGWLKAEFDLLGVDFHRRGRIVDEYVAAMIELWTSPEPAFRGEFVAFEGLVSDPKPVQRPYPPLWFAGDVPAVLARVARWGSGWSPYQTAPDRIPEMLDRIRSHPEYRGRPIGVYYSLLNLELGPEHVAVESAWDFGSWDAQRIAEQLRRLAEWGVTEVTAPVTRVEDLEGYLDRLRWIGEEVMPLLDEG